MNVINFLNGSFKCPSILEHPFYKPSTVLCILVAECFLLGTIAGKVLA